MKRRTSTWCVAIAALAAFAAPAHSQDSKPIYSCPGNSYTDALSAKEAHDKGCHVMEGAPITIIQSTPRPAARVGTPVPPAASRPGDTRVSAAEQRARDSDARAILVSELAKEQAQLEAMRRDFNNGEPERRGDERNYQKYIDRVAEMRAALARKESDVEAIRRELGKMPP
jgi:hypothetical protein